MLIELGTVPGGVLPVTALKDHLRLGTGFADGQMQDTLLESQIRAALSAIEGRIGKALISRSFKLVLSDWRDPAGQALPIAPVASIASVTMLDASGATNLVLPTRYRLIPDRHRPRLMAVGTSLPGVPTDGLAEVVFEAGFGPTWASVPADLAQAVLMLAAEYYENRHELGGAPAGLPRSVQVLIEPWRNVRVLGGGAA